MHHLENALRLCRPCCDAAAQKVLRERVHPRMELPPTDWDSDACVCGERDWRASKGTWLWCMCQALMTRWAQECSGAFRDGAVSLLVEAVIARSGGVEWMEESLAAGHGACWWRRPARALP